MKTTILTMLTCGLLLSASTLASDPSLGPAITGYGPTFAIVERDVALQDDFVYRAVFDSAAYEDETAINVDLVSVARYLNMHARNGVPLKNMDLAVVVHGAALKNLLKDTAYQSRYGIRNPNLELIGKLHAAGVQFFVCGQSMAFGGVDKQALIDDVQVALSAMTMLTVLQTQGYALLP